MLIRNPRGLLGRSALIVVVPILLLQAVVAGAFVQLHYDRVTRQLTGVFVRELHTMANTVSEAANPEQLATSLRQLSEVYAVELSIQPDLKVSAGIEKSWWDVTGGIAGYQLRTSFDTAVRVILPTDSRTAEVRMRTSKGTLVVNLSRWRLVSSNPYLVLAWSAGAAVLLIAISLLFLTNQVRPIRRLAEAADAFGTGRFMELRPRGAREVRQATTAFLDMRSRIQRHIEQRTLIPMALSHDLRTPITRMRLALEMESDQEEIRRSLDEMDRVVEDFLEFARDEWHESGAMVDVGDLVEEVAAAARANGWSVQTQVDLPFDQRRIPVRAGAMRRCLGNLIENGARHGGEVRLAVALSGKNVAFAIEDAGVGIPETRREEMLEPFRRLDDQKSMGGGKGLGLGLAIARNIARLHGGELTLGSGAELQGLRAVVTIPV